MAIDRAQKAGEPDIEEMLDDVALRIERLRVLYEQYFMGIEKLEPHNARKEVSRKILELQQMNIRNTGLRFRFNTTLQKFSVYTTYWNRTVRAIEAGTYFRDVAKVGRLAAQKGQDIPEEVLRAMPERLRAKVLREREQLAARQAKQAQRDAAAAPGAAADDAADELARAENTQPSGLPALPGLADLSGQVGDDADIDSALDNLFGEAEDAVAKVVERAPTRTRPPPMVAPAAPAAAAPAAPPRASTPPPVPRTTTPPPVPASAKTPPPVPASAKTPPPVPASAKTPVPVSAKTPPPDARTPTPALRTPTPSPHPPAVSLPAGVDESAARDLHRKYVQAKRLLGENVDNIKYEHIVATIAKQVPTIMKQHQARSVEFQVVIKDDKVILKATPKK